MPTKRCPGWPAVLFEGPVGLRPIRRSDALLWKQVHDRNADWLAPWEASSPQDYVAQPIEALLEREGMSVRQGTVDLAGYRSYVRGLLVEARRGTVMPFTVTWKGEFAGQMIATNIQRGALNSASIGYWVDQAYAGRQITPTALAILVDYLLGPVRLHRVEVCIRPENTKSLRVVEKLGLRCEGLRPRYMHIAGGYRDHLAFAVDTEDVQPGGLLARWQATGLCPA